MGQRHWRAMIAASVVISAPAQAQDDDALRSKLDAAMAMIERQQEQLDRQAAQIAELRSQVDASLAERSEPATAAQAAARTSSEPVAATQAPVQLERVGEAPEDFDRPIELAVLDSHASVVTRRGQLSGDLQFDYARADRSRAVFRGIELVEAVLVGVFDINESRQDVLSGSLALRYGVTDRLELGARLPYIYRADTSIVAPIAGSTNDDMAATIDSSVDGHGIGDLELTARYQLVDGRSGSPYVIANLQGVIPTGADPFTVERDFLGRPMQVSTGAGFYGISPSVTMLLPSDPVVLFGTLGYTFNLGKKVDSVIPPVRITYVDPGDAISVSTGVGISLNQRTTINLGYAHSWAFGTMTRTSLLDPTPNWPGMREAVSRDLQIGRLLFGVTYRVSDQTSLNWSIEMGATEDATDLRTVLRVPFVLLTGR